MSGSNIKYHARDLTWPHVTLNGRPTVHKKSHQRSCESPDISLISPPSSLTARTPHQAASSLTRQRDVHTSHAAATVIPPAWQQACGLDISASNTLKRVWCDEASCTRNPSPTSSNGVIKLGAWKLLSLHLGLPGITSCFPGPTLRPKPRRRVPPQHLLLQQPPFPMPQFLIHRLRRLWNANPLTNRRCPNSTPRPSTSSP
jgi:hypothetical protein